GPSHHETRQMAEQGERSAVGPVQIIEDEHQRRTSRYGREHLRHRVEQTLALVLRRDGCRLGKLGKTCAQLRRDLRDDATEGTEILAKRGLVTAACMVRDGLGEGSVRPRELPVEAAPPEYPRACCFRPIRELLKESGLSDAGFACAERKAPLPRQGCVEPARESLLFPGATHERRAREPRPEILVARARGRLVGHESIEGRESQLFGHALVAQSIQDRVQVRWKSLRTERCDDGY